MKCLLRLLCWVVLVGVGSAQAQTAGTVTLTATPVSGAGGIAVKVSWASTPAAASCALTGGGITNPTAAASGTVSDSITKTTTYGVSCAWSRTSNTLHWTAPTLKTDGSALTDLTNYVITWAPVGSNSNTTTLVSDPTATSFVITPAAAGTYAYVLQACEANNLCSAPSAAVTGPPVGTATATAAATTTVTPIPVVPVGLTVQ